MTAEPTDSVKRAARAICAAYGDDFDEQPADLAALREWRKNEGRVDADGVGIVRAYDPGLPTQADWIECAIAALLTTREPSEEEISAGRDALANFEISDWRTASSPAKWADMARACLIAAGRVRTAE